MWYAMRDKANFGMYSLHYFCCQVAENENNILPKNIEKNKQKKEHAWKTFKSIESNS